MRGGAPVLEIPRKTLNNCVIKLSILTGKSKYLSHKRRAKYDSVDKNNLIMRDSRADSVTAPTHLCVVLPTLPSAMDANVPPPVITNQTEIPPPMPDYTAPPPYDMALNLDVPISTKLPTYEEVQREKQMESDAPAQPRTYTAFVTVNGNALPMDDNLATNDLLGTDYMFLTAFFVAFLFNWIGFLLLMCFCHTVASRYGALAGFGLSLAKWTLIVKHSTAIGSHENTWLWWLIMGFGVLICLRAILQYLNIKRGWRLLSGTAQERLLFFY